MFQTDPSGTYSAWKANAIGRNSKSVREYLEKNYPEEGIESPEDTIKLALRALLEVVESGSKNVEVAILTRDQELRFLEDSELDPLIKAVEQEKEMTKTSKQEKQT